MARGKVLRPMLEREQELVNKGDGGKSELSPANYEFTEAGRDGDGARVVQLKPRRQDVTARRRPGGPERRRRSAAGRGEALEEPVLLDQPGEHRPALRAHRRRAGPGGDGDHREGEVRRHAQLRGALRLPERQRPPGRAQRAALSSARAYRCAIRFVSRRDVSVLDVDRQRLLQQPPLLRRIRDRRRQGDVGEHRLPLRQLHRLVEIRPRGGRRSAEQRRQAVERDQRLVDRAALPGVVERLGAAAAARGRRRLRRCARAGSAPATVPPPTTPPSSRATARPRLSSASAPRQDRRPASAP